MPDSYKSRLDSAQKAYDRSVGALETLQQQRDTEMSRLLEAHGVTTFEGLMEVKDRLTHEVESAERDVEAAFKEAGL